MCAAVTATASALPMSSGAANKANSTTLSATSTAAAAGAAAIATAAAANKENVGAGAVAAATAAGAAAAAGGAGAIQKSSVTCRYYLLGICHFGSLCRFSHDDAAAAAATPVVAGDVISKTNSDNSTSSSSSSSAAAAAATTSTVAATTSAAAASKNKLTNWINAPAFVPSGKKLFNYADIDESDGYEVGGDGGVDGTTTASATSSSAANKTWAEIVGGQDQAAAAANAIQYSAPPATVDVLCPYKSPCPYGDYCAYTMHLELCKMCDMYVLHPCDIEQRRKHNQACLLQHEKDMELSFAIARSRDKTCGICMDIIMEKQGREKRFGILPNCTHIFCLECIRKWRQAKQFDHKITRSCPECRIASDFVCPSAFWVETKEEKDKLLTDYRAALNVKDCKYFKKGSGKCPFGNKCFYKHALANGELVDVGLPRRSRKLLHQTSELIDLLDIYLWEFVDHRNYNFLDLLSNTSDLSDDSDFES